MNLTDLRSGTADHSFLVIPNRVVWCHLLIIEPYGLISKNLRADFDPSQCFPEYIAQILLANMVAKFRSHLATAAA